MSLFLASRCSEARNKIKDYQIMVKYLKSWVMSYQQGNQEMGKITKNLRRSLTKYNIASGKGLLLNVFCYFSL